MIEVEHLSKSYGSAVALVDVSFTVKSGEVVGFLGPNGAGKSTTLRILAGVLSPTSGKARVAGYDVQKEALLARGRVGYLPETTPLYPEMRVEEYLRFRARIKGVARRETGLRLAEALNKCGVADCRRQLIGTLSRGYRQRVGLAEALLAAPPVLMLDEPTAGLDPMQRVQFRQLIRSLKSAYTVLLSTHILPEVEQAAERVLILHRGRLVLPEKVQGLLSARALEIILEGEAGRCGELLCGLPQFEAVERLEKELPVAGRRHVFAARLAAQTGDDEARRAVFQAVARAGDLTLLGLSTRTRTLEEIFSQIVSGEEAGEEAQ